MLYHFYPAFRGTGGRIVYLSDDFKKIRIKVPLNWRTRNYVGTIFGGSMYAAVDPIYMVMFIKCLGDRYIVWDRSATIEFKKPGTSTLYADFSISNKDLKDIRQKLEIKKKLVRDYSVELKDSHGVVCCSVVKTLHFMKRNEQIEQGH